MSPAPEPRVVWEDAALAVVAKPAGLVVHPGAGGAGTGGETLVEILARSMALAPAGGPQRPGIVHRLDKDTSGLMLVAKTDRAHAALVAMMKAHDVRRWYLALAAGSLKAPSGRIEAPIGRSPRNRTRMAVVAGGRSATTSFKVLESLGKATLLEVAPETGRTHQIRVHLAHIGHPIAGDLVYGSPQPGAEMGLHRPFLHSAKVELVHPLTGEGMVFEEPLPADLRAVLEALRKNFSGNHPADAR